MTVLSAPRKNVRQPGVAGRSRGVRDWAPRSRDADCLIGYGGSATFDVDWSDPKDPKFKFRELLGLTGTSDNIPICAREHFRVKEVILKRRQPVGVPFWPKPAVGQQQISLHFTIQSKCTNSKKPDTWICYPNGVCD